MRAADGGSREKPTAVAASGTGRRDREGMGCPWGSGVRGPLGDSWRRVRRELRGPPRQGRMVQDGPVPDGSARKSLLRSNSPPRSEASICTMELSRSCVSRTDNVRNRQGLSCGFQQVLLLPSPPQRVWEKAGVVGRVRGWKTPWVPGTQHFWSPAIPVARAPPPSITAVPTRRPPG